MSSLVLPLLNTTGLATLGLDASEVKLGYVLSHQQKNSFRQRVLCKLFSSPCAHVLAIIVNSRF